MSTVTISNKNVVSIANTVRDYQGGGVMTPERIMKWVNQFDEEYRNTILQEMDLILKKLYVSKVDAINFLRNLLQEDEIVGKDFKNNYNKVEFLNIQTRGHSQKELLELLDEILLEEYGVYSEECGTDSNSNTYIYIDDCFFTGNRVHRDIEGWVKNANPNSTLHIVFFGIHNLNFEYIREKIEEILAPKEITLRFWYFREILMDSWARGKYECCWPTYTEGNENVDSFVEFLNEQRELKKWKPLNYFRDANKPYDETLFSSKEARGIVESAFLDKGIEIFNLPLTPNHSMMPMGYTYNYTLGFGSLFVTYRNVANNCPSVLWWGDPNKHYPLNQWLPLFPRKTNS